MIAAGFAKSMEVSRHGSVRTSLQRAIQAGPAMLLLAVVAATLSLIKADAQQTVSSGGEQVSSRPARQSISAADQSLVASPGSPIFQERRLRQLNLAQHKALVSDTDKLLKLVNELNAEINASNPQALTPDQLRQVAEIEKLARSVKDKMRISTQGSLEFLDATPAIAPDASRH